MKQSIGSIIALIVTLSSVVIVSGCATSAPEATPTPAPAATPASTATPTPISGVTPASLFDHARFDWYQYRISGMMGMSMVHTYRYANETVDSQPASHVNVTMDMLPETLIYLDIWSKPSDGGALKIHEILIKDGIVARDFDIDAANFSKWEGEDLASPKFANAILSASGSETVTIGNKTYEATKYTGASGDARYTYWSVKDVPVPLKFLVQDGQDTEYVLTGWG
jgi:hypothetical protein